MNSRQVGKLRSLLVEYKKYFYKDGNANPTYNDLLTAIDKQLRNREAWAQSIELLRTNHSQRGKDEG